MMKLIIIVFAAVAVLMSHEARAEFIDSSHTYYLNQVHQDTIYPDIEATGPEWPDAIPLDIPQFSEGAMTGAENNDGDEHRLWTIKYSDVVKNALSNYKDLLVANGFRASEIIGLNGSSRFTATQDGIKVVCVFRNGNVVLTITTKF